MSQHHVNNPAGRWIHCTHCGLRGYPHRGDAKAAKKEHRGVKGIAVFPCPHTEGIFHLGQRPKALTSGQIGQHKLRAQARGLAAARGTEHADTLRNPDQTPNTTPPRDAAVDTSNVVPLFSHPGNPEVRGAAAVVAAADRPVAIETLDDAAFEEYELRCLPAGSHFKVSAVDMNGRRIHPLFSGRTGTVLDAPPFPVTDPDGELREVLHSVQYDGDATTSTLSDLWMTVAASASAIR